jgi:hypothetical protein
MCTSLVAVEYVVKMYIMDSMDRIYLQKYCWVAVLEWFNNVSLIGTSAVVVSALTEVGANPDEIIELRM